MLYVTLASAIKFIRGLLRTAPSLACSSRAGSLKVIAIGCGVEARLDYLFHWVIYSRGLLQRR
jgi:hypothetical protein